MNPLFTKTSIKDRSKQVLQKSKIAQGLKARYRKFQTEQQALPRGKRILRAIYYLVLAGLGMMLVGLIIALLLLFISVAQLPSADELVAKTVAQQSTKILDRNGTLLYEIHGDERRTVVTLDQISPYMAKATLAAEDDEFYSHPGYDWKGVLRSVYLNTAGRLFGGNNFLVGGSTITQQFVKNAYLSNDKNLVRKIKELILSLKLESNLKSKEEELLKSTELQPHWVDLGVCDEEQLGLATCRAKNKILELYLNRIPFGGTAYGAETASNNFFGKSVKDLDLAQSATLAAIPQRPSYFSPYGSHLDELFARKDWVLGRMLELGYITKTEYEQAKAEPITFVQSKEEIKAPHFVFYIKELLEQKYDKNLLEAGGLVVTTTLNYELQKIAEQKVADGAKRNETTMGAKNAALVSLDPQTGQILAMVGSKDFFDQAIDGQVNVTTSYRQPGSSFKPLVYASAFLKGFYPGNVLFDVVTNFGQGYEPKDYDLKERGPVSMRTALANSLNIPAIKALHLAGLESTLDLAQRMGIKNLGREQADEYGLSLALGTAGVRLLDLVTAYGVFANGGYYHEPVAILEVKDSRGKVLEKYGETDILATATPEPVLNPEVAYLVTDVLSDAGARPANWGYLNVPGYKVAVKTGTSTKPKPGTDKLYPNDILTVGYTPQLVTGVWAGNTDGEVLFMNADGITGAAPIWNGFMAEALKKFPDKPFVRPEGIQEIAVTTTTGFLPSKNTPPDKIKTEVFTSFSKPERVDNGSRSAVVDSVTGKLATEYTPPALRVTYVCDDYHSILYYYNQNDPQFERWESRVRAWAKKQREGQVPDPFAQVQYLTDCSQLPTEYDTLHDAHSIEDMPQITLLYPVPGGRMQRGSNTIRLQLSSVDNLSRIEYYWDGELKGTVSQAPWNQFNFEVEQGLALDSWHKLLVKVYDMTGMINLAQADVTIVNDAFEPQLELIRPTAGQEFLPGSELTVEAIASDDGSGLTELEFTLDGTFLASLDEPPFDLKVKIPENIKYGEHTLTIRAFDADNNVSRLDQIIKVPAPALATN